MRRFFLPRSNKISYALRSSGIGDTKVRVPRCSLSINKRISSTNQIIELYSGKASVRSRQQARAAALCTRSSSTITTAPTTTPAAPPAGGGSSAHSLLLPAPPPTRCPHQQYHRPTQQAQPDSAPATRTPYPYPPPPPPALLLLLWWWFGVWYYVVDGRRRWYPRPHMRRGGGQEEKKQAITILHIFMSVSLKSRGQILCNRSLRPFWSSEPATRLRTTLK